MNSKKSIIAILLVAIIGVVGLTIAYFSNTATIENEFQTNSYGTTVEEVFTSPDNWTPGTTTPKTLTVTNSGNVDEAVRVEVTESWMSKNDDPLPLKQNGNDAAIINWANSNDWTKVTENNKTYYYYNYKLAPTETTSELLNSVTFNPLITNDSDCETDTSVQGVKTVTCNSTGDGYDDAVYKLTFHIETVQYDKYVEAWGTNVDIAAEKPGPETFAQLIIRKSNAAEVNNYTDGVTTEAYTFNHTQTDQTPALTDYRYIGASPYNYVNFNCDNDGTNCEIWRAIGVFSVDDGAGNIEQRVKLVRGSAFEQTMVWDSNGVNEWSTASLNLFLNGDYLNRENSASNYGLKSLARSQIDDTKFYLGGRAGTNNGNVPKYGSTSDMYEWERGEETFSHETYCLNYPSSTKCASNYCENNPTDEICNDERTTSWIGKVALLYPSDYGYTYSKGVESDCFGDPSRCVNQAAACPTCTYNYPETGWIYNSNNNLGNRVNYFLSPSSRNNDYVFYESYGGSVGENGGANGNVVADGLIRPVVYLKSSVQVDGGTGQSTDPYVLK